MTRLVTVIVPVYNVEPYLEECMASIRRQTFKNIEVILVDDGSTDKSGLIGDDYVKRDKRIRIIHQQNLGHGPACNKGIDQARGEYVMFCDGDDFYFPKMVERLVLAVEASKVDVATATAYAFETETGNVSMDPNYSVVPVPYVPPDDCLTRSQIIKYAWRLPVQYWAKIYNLAWLRRNKIRFTNKKMSYDDTSFHWQILVHANKMALLREQLYGYRMNRPGASYTSIKQPEYYDAHKLAEEVVREIEPLMLDDFYQWFVAEMMWLKGREKVQPEIATEFEQKLLNWFQSPNCSLGTKAAIQNYFHNGTIAWRVKEKLRHGLYEIYRDIFSHTHHP